jgi:threonine aldolase
MFGKEAGVFTPTGSLANQLAIRMLVAPGEELLAETNSHIVRAELGAAAVFSGITTRTWPAVNGLLKAADALEIARPDSGPYLVSTTHITSAAAPCSQFLRLPPFMLVRKSLG